MITELVKGTSTADGVLVMVTAFAEVASATNPGPEMTVVVKSIRTSADRRTLQISFVAATASALATG